MSDEKKQKLKEYQKNYCETKKLKEKIWQCISEKMGSLKVPLIKIKDPLILMK